MLFIHFILFFSNDELGDVMQHIVSNNNIDMNSPANIIVARDTRSVCLSSKIIFEMCSKV